MKSFMMSAMQIRADRRNYKVRWSEETLRSKLHSGVCAVANARASTPGTSWADPTLRPICQDEFAALVDHPTGDRPDA